MIKAFFKDGVIYTLPSIISRGLYIILIPLYTRVLSPADYGAWDMLLVFMNLIQLTVALEISQAVARFYFEEKDEYGKIKCASTALWFTVFTNGLFFILAQVFAGFISKILLGSEDYILVFRLGLIYIFFNSLFYLVQNQFRWELKSKKYAIVSIIVSITTALVSILLAYLLKKGLTGIMLGTIIGSVAGTIYGFIFLKNTFKFSFSFQKLKTMLLFSSPLVFSGIAVFISHYIDRIMIRHYLSLEALGIYSLAFRFSSVISIVMVGFNSALTPLVYKHYKDKETPQHLADIFRYFIFFALLAYLALSLFSSEIMLLFTTPEFYPAAKIIVFLVPAIILSNMYIFAPGIAIKKKTKIILIINVVGAVLQVLFNYLFIPLFGYFGAAFATCLGNMCLFLMYITISQKLFYVPHKFSTIIIGFIFVILVLLVSMKIEIGLFYGILLKIGLIIFTIFIFYLLKMIKKNEIRYIIDTINKTLHK